MQLLTFSQITLSILNSTSSDSYLLRLSIDTLQYKFFRLFKQYCMKVVPVLFVAEIDRYLKVLTLPHLMFIPVSHPSPSSPDTPVRNNTHCIRKVYDSFNGFKEEDFLYSSKSFIYNEKKKYIPAKSNSSV